MILETPSSHGISRQGRGGHPALLYREGWLPEELDTAKWHLCSRIKEVLTSGDGQAGALLHSHAADARCGFQLQAQKPRAPASPQG